jgi:hypothetical protein
MVDDNWFLTIPIEILNHIFAFVDEEISMMMTKVSHSMARYIIDFFHQIEYLQFDLGEYGSKYGYLGIIKWVVGNSIKKIAHKYLLGKQYPGSYDDLDLMWHVSRTAARYGHLDLVKWTCENSSNLIRHVCMNAADRGQLHIVRWACAQKDKLGNTICKMHEARCMRHEVANIAAFNGNLEMLKWAYDTSNHNIRMNDCAIAATRQSHLKILQWMVTIGYNFDRSVYQTVLFYDQMKILMWMKDQHSDWIPALCREAELLGMDGALRWLNG